MVRPRSPHVRLLMAEDYNDHGWRLDHWPEAENNHVCCYVGFGA
jgi:hypothetical protein